MSDAIEELKRLRERITRCNDMHDVDAELRARIAELESIPTAEEEAGQTDREYRERLGS